MKYLKMFEEYQKPVNEFWKIRTENPWLDISLDKIGVMDHEKEHYLDEVKFYIGNKYIYVGLDYNANTITSGMGSEYYFSVAKEDFDGYEYRGEPEITQEDIEKWNFENDTKRYNL
jgi:hypothetical protein